MFVWMAKFGAAYGVRTGIHVGVDVIVNQLEPAAPQPVILFGLLCGALFTFIVGTMGAKFVIGLIGTDQVSPDLELPSWIVFLCVPLGSYLMCFRFLQVAGRSGAPASCRTTIPAMSRAWSKARRRRDLQPRSRRDERRPHLRPADRADADRHADLDRARPDRAHLPVHA